MRQRFRSVTNFGSKKTAAQRGNGASRIEIERIDTCRGAGEAPAPRHQIRQTWPSLFPALRNGAHVYSRRTLFTLLILLHYIFFVFYILSSALSVRYGTSVCPLAFNGTWLQSNNDAGFGMLPDSGALRSQAVFAAYRCQFSWQTSGAMNRDQPVFAQLLRFLPCSHCADENNKNGINAHSGGIKFAPTAVIFSIG